MKWLEINCSWLSLRNRKIMIHYKTVGCITKGMGSGEGKKYIFIKSMIIKFNNQKQYHQWPYMQIQLSSCNLNIHKINQRCLYTNQQTKRKTNIHKCKTNRHQHKTSASGRTKMTHVREATRAVSSQVLHRPSRSQVISYRKINSYTKTEKKVFIILHNVFVD